MEQRIQIRKYQHSSWHHPLTCAKRHEPGHFGEAVLWVEEDGLHCFSCDYHQTWVPAIILAMDLDAINSEMRTLFRS